MLRYIIYYTNIPRYVDSQFLSFIEIIIFLIFLFNVLNDVFNRLFYFFLFCLCIALTFHFLNLVIMPKEYNKIGVAQLCLKFDCLLHRRIVLSRPFSICGIFFSPLSIISSNCKLLQNPLSVFFSVTFSQFVRRTYFA